VAQALGQSEGAVLREEAGMLGAASEAKAVVGVLKKRLKSKTKEEAMLSQEVRSCDAKVEVLKNELMSEVKAKEMITRDLEDEKSKLIDLRLRYTEKGKEEVQHLKKVHQLEIQLKDVTARLENKVEGERYAMLARKEAKAKLADCENTIMKLKYDNASAQSMLDAEKQNATSLKAELSRKQNQLMRENHANKIEIEGLQKVVLEKEATAAELQAEVREANEEVKSLTDALEKNTEQAELMKSRLTRTLHSEEDRVARLGADLSDKRRRESMLSADIASGEQREAFLQKQLEASSRTETELNAALNDCRKQITNLENRLQSRHKENAKLTTTVEGSKAECKGCEEKIEHVESDYRVTAKQLRKEQQHVADLEARLHEETLVDEDRQHALRTAKTYTKILEDRLQAKSEAQSKAESELSGAQARIEDMEAKLTELREEEDRLKGVLEEKLKDNEMTDKALCECESEFVFFTHQSELKARELRNLIDERSEVVARLERQLQIAEAKSDNLKQLMNQTNEEALEAKGVLEKRITEVQAKDAQLRCVIGEKESQVRDLTDNLETEQDKVSQLTAELMAAEKEIVDLKDEHQRRVARLSSKLAAKQQEAISVTEQLEAAQNDLKNNTGKYDGAVKLNEDLTKQLRLEEMAAHKLENQTSELKKLEIEAKIRIRSLEDSLKLLKKRLQDKVEEASRLRKMLNASETKSEFQQQQLQDEETAKGRIQNALETERVAIGELERELKFKEGQFEADSLTVKARITELQNALVERAEAAQRLQGALVSARANSAHLKNRLQAAQEASVDQRENFERILDQEEKQIAALSRDLSSKKLNEMKLTGDLQRNEALLSQLENQLQDGKDEEEILRGDVEMAREEASMLQEKLDKRGNYEKELLDQLEEKEAYIASLKSKVQQRALEEKNMVKEVEQAEKKTAQLRIELVKRKKAEEVLVRELEAAKIEFSKVSPSETVDALQGQMLRAEASRAQYANVLLKILRREGVSVP